MKTFRMLKRRANQTTTQHPMKLPQRQKRRRTRNPIRREQNKTTTTSMDFQDSQQHKASIHFFYGIRSHTISHHAHSIYIYIYNQTQFVPYSTIHLQTYILISSAKTEFIPLAFNTDDPQ